MQQNRNSVKTAGRHERIYTILLVILGILAVVMMVTIEFMMVPVRMQKHPDSMTALHLMTGIYGLVFSAIMLTLVLRSKKPSMGRVLSKIVNVLIMYPFFPLGVAVGIYGFRKVDKETSKETKAV
jgi:flagellar basal body-associated protein FliL